MISREVVTSIGYTPFALLSICGFLIYFTRFNLLLLYFNLYLWHSLDILRLLRYYSQLRATVHRGDKKRDQ